MDILTKQQRSHRMSLIRSADTAIELKLRKLIWSRGMKGFRVKSKIIGRPDIYFPRKGLAIFADGCFWHGCEKCFKAPRRNKKYWSAKIERNKKRDMFISHHLKNFGIKVIRLWEHEVNSDLEKCYSKIDKAINNAR